MKIRRLHKIIGLTLLLPFIGWVATGFIFFVKPGYAGAYEMLELNVLPMVSSKSGNPPAPPDSAVSGPWLEIRQLKTILGEHLLVRTGAGWEQLDPAMLRPRPVPGEEDLRRLLNDAFTANPDRYGTVASFDGATATTTTGVTVSLDWNRLSLYQRGPDTDRIDFLYKIHYLQWTGIDGLDRVLGVAGLALVLALSILGVTIAVRR